MQQAPPLEQQEAPRHRAPKQGRSQLQQPSHLRCGSSTTRPRNLLRGMLPFPRHVSKSTLTTGKANTAPARFSVARWSSSTTTHSTAWRKCEKVQKKQKNVVDTARDTYKDGTKFRISNVALLQKAKPEYNNAPVKQTVDLLQTTTSKLLQDATTHSPQPAVTCAECVAFKSQQAFDITALVDTVSALRTVEGRKCVRDVTLIDGSTQHGYGDLQASTCDHSKPSNIVCPKVSVFYTLNPDQSDPPFVQKLLEATGKPIPFHFYGLNAQATGKGYKIETMRSWYNILPADGPKTLQLTNEHAAILAAKTTRHIVTLETKWTPEGDQESLQGIDGQETLCAHLGEMSKLTGVPSLDGKPSVWQVNWAFSSVVPGTHVTSTGDKLWLNLVVQDVSGRFEARMPEKVALELSGVPTKDEFLRALADGDAVFPTILAVKLARRVKTQSQTQEYDEQTFVNMTVLSASAQDLDMPRTRTVMQLIPILRSFTALPTAILPASLSMLTPSNLYPMLVKYPETGLDPQPCHKAWVLLKAAKKSKCTDEPPYMVTTDDVEDVLHPSGVPPPAKKYKLMSMCSKEGRTSLILTPAHGKPVFALALITSVQGDTLFAETVEAIQKDDKDKLMTTMRQEMTLAVELMRHVAGGKPTAWNDMSSPLAASRCRSLGRSPTGPELDPIDAQSAKSRRIE